LVDGDEHRRLRRLPARPYNLGINRLDVEYVLASKRLYSDGAVILYDYAEREDEQLAGLTEVVSRQQVFSPVVAKYLRRIEYGTDDWATRLASPMTRRPIVLVDPTRSFGQPIFARGAAPVEKRDQSVEGRGVHRRGRQGLRRPQDGRPELPRSGPSRRSVIASPELAVACEDTSTVSPAFLRRVKLKNYKSIAACDVELSSLTFLVGPNGAGKSNFLDALRLVTDALSVTLDYALRERGGINEVRRRSGGHPNHFGVRLEFQLANGDTGHYAFDVGAKRGGGFGVRTEDCLINPGDLTQHPVSFRVRDGRLTTNVDVLLPEPATDRLFLTAASAAPEFRPLFDALTHMGFYNLAPESIRDLQAPDAGGLLLRDGGNIASVLGQLEASAPEVKERIEEYLNKVVPSIRGVTRLEIGSRETLEFRQQVAGQRFPWRFQAASMSDGTLRALGVLVALMQTGNGEGGHVMLVGVEEPELALHPAAAGVLLDALRSASERVQIIVTSHSPDLLDDESIPTESLLAVTSDGDVTVIGSIDESGRVALRKRLFTPGELLRLDQLHPEQSARELAMSQQLDSFRG
jgi:predicted ATPase